MRNMKTRLFYALALVVAVITAVVIVDRYQASVLSVAGSNPATADVVVAPTTEPPTTTTTVDPHDAIELAAAMQRNEAWEFVGMWHESNVIAYAVAVKAGQDEYARQVAAARRAQSVAPQGKPVARPSTAVAKPQGGGGAAPGGFLACVRQRESGGSYTALNPSGAAGAYQLMPATARATANHAGRPDLANRPVLTWSPADQDAMAQHLLSWQGTSPWAYPARPC